MSEVIDQATATPNQRLDLPRENVGDVIFIPRTISAIFPRGESGHGDQLTLYQHAGIVIEVKDGVATKVVHFDPIFDSAGEGRHFGEYFGTKGTPEALEGDALEVKFPWERRYVHSRADPANVPDILARVEASMHVTLVYNLKEYNCQHYASEMQTGTARSANVEAFTRGLQDGIRAAASAGKELLDSDLVTAGLTCAPFGQSCLGQIGNVVARLGFAVILVIALIAVCSIVALGNTISSYLPRVNRRKPAKSRGRRIHGPSQPREGHTRRRDGHPGAH
eukprot:Opistho-1_new@13947